MELVALLSSLMGLAFVSGLRLYGTVLALGLGIRTGFIRLDPAMSRLDVLGDPLVITIAGVIYVVEFFADKIPWVDSIWDSIHTLIRPLGAAVLGAVAIGDVDPRLKLSAFLVCGSVALASHTGKAGIRLAVNHSPEPFTNIGISVAEDLVAAVGVWLAVAYPYVMAALIAIWLAALAWILPKIYRAARRALTTAYRRLGKLAGVGRAERPVTRLL
ncbi:MAG TPA: DUF4126 domain-containing protein [Methylomirabilota bacterium]|jgi:hypothetical protein